MNTQEEYRLSLYKDFGKLGIKENVRLVRNTLNGKICVKKIVSQNLKEIYEYLMNNPSEYIPQIYECVGDGESLIIIEEYIEGKTLEERVRENTFTEKETVWLIKEICKALKPLHSATSPIICRDLKAENIMLDSRNRVKIVDFDIARIYQEGKNRDTVLLGTAEYAAPEQFGYFQTDARTDIYALGILVNFVYTGMFPVEEIAAGKLGLFIKRCTYMDPKERFQTVDEVLKYVDFIFPQYIIKKIKPEEESDSWLPPGFRSKKLWKVMVAVTGYLFITAVALGMEITKEEVLLTGAELHLERFCFWLSQICFIFWLCDYRKCYTRWSCFKNYNILIRIVGYFSMYIMFVVIAVILCGIIGILFS